MASFYTSPIKVNDVPMDPAAVTARFAPLVSASEFTLYRLEDGKFAEVWDLTDMDAVMRQIGQGEA